MISQSSASTLMLILNIGDMSAEDSSARRSAGLGRNDIPPAAGRLDEVDRHIVRPLARDATTAAMMDLCKEITAFARAGGPPTVAPFAGQPETLRDTWVQAKCRVHRSLRDSAPVRGRTGPIADCPRRSTAARRRPRPAAPPRRRR